MNKKSYASQLYRIASGLEKLAAARITRVLAWPSEKYVGQYGYSVQFENGKLSDEDFVKVDLKNPKRSIREAAKSLGRVPSGVGVMLLEKRPSFVRSKKQQHVKRETTKFKRELLSPEELTIANDFRDVLGYAIVDFVGGGEDLVTALGNFISEKITTDPLREATLLIIEEFLISVEFPSTGTLEDTLGIELNAEQKNALKENLEHLKDTIAAFLTVEPEYIEETTEEVIGEGDEVIHPKFGHGIVRGLRQGAKVIAEVSFDSGEEKSIAIDFLKKASLVKLAKKFETKSEELKYWREKKKTAYKHLERAKATNNGGWIKMLEKRIEKYKKKIKSLA